MELFKASHQWASRPDDERFWTLGEMYQSTKHYADLSQEIPIKVKNLEILTQDGEILVAGKQGRQAKLTHHAFGQLSARVGAPANYLRHLPAELAALNIRAGLATMEDEGKESRALFHSNGSLVMRAVTSDRYARIWNHEIVSRLLDLEAMGWKNPPAKVSPSASRGRIATEQDVLSCGAGGGVKVKVGDTIGPAGLYASDHDMFAFLVNDENRIEDGTEEGLCRGFFVSNSEVGAKSFQITKFMFRGVCGNHIVWGAEGVQELSIRHIGNAQERAWGGLEAELREYANSSVSDLEAQISKAKRISLGKDKDSVLDYVFGKKIPGLSRKTLSAGYDAAALLRDECGAGPDTVWGLSQGLTRVSQESAYADDRTVIDVGVGRLLDSVF